MDFDEVHTIMEELKRKISNMWDIVIKYELKHDIKIKEGDVFERAQALIEQLDMRIIP